MASAASVLAGVTGAARSKRSSEHLDAINRTKKAQRQVAEAIEQPRLPASPHGNGSNGSQAMFALTKRPFGHGKLPDRTPNVQNMHGPKVKCKKKNRLQCEAARKAAQQAEEKTKRQSNSKVGGVGSSTRLHNLLQQIDPPAAVAEATSTLPPPYRWITVQDVFPKWPDDTATKQTLHKKGEQRRHRIHWFNYVTHTYSGDLPANWDQRKRALEFVELCKQVNSWRKLQLVQWAALKWLSRLHSPRVNCAVRKATKRQAWQRYAMYSKWSRQQMVRGFQIIGVQNKRGTTIPSLWAFESVCLQSFTGLAMKGIASFACQSHAKRADISLQAAEEDDRMGTLFNSELVRAHGVHMDDTVMQFHRPRTYQGKTGMKELLDSCGGVFGIVSKGWLQQNRVPFSIYPVMQFIFREDSKNMNRPPKSADEMTDDFVFSAAKVEAYLYPWKTVGEMIVAGEYVEWVWRNAPPDKKDERPGWSLYNAEAHAARITAKQAQLDARPKPAAAKPSAGWGGKRKEKAEAENDQGGK
mmetsp:Transcript_56025/g.114528  ORF Transcript_56025/g.114528 Transcript_56025/m.114528 type:complete len:526 (-) Transcript_56025:7-1584(-)